MGIAFGKLFSAGSEFFLNFRANGIGPWGSRSVIVLLLSDGGAYVDALIKSSVSLSRC